MTQLPINWRAVVEEAKNRRKQEGLSQRDLAALAGVSIPTITSFERGETNLQFDKVIAILDSLGLFVAPGRTDSLEAFAQAARRSWEELVADLPPSHPSRQPLGHSEQAYSLENAVAEPSLAELRNILGRAPETSGWPPFWVPHRQPLRPIIRDNVVECWMGHPEADRAFKDAAHSDFWQVSRDGQAFLQRGYQEDGENLEPGTILDVTLPIWRTGEALLHAAWLARQLGAQPNSKIHFFGRYTGLNGRRLFSWAKPLLHLGLGDWHRARSDSVDLGLTAPVQEIEDALASCVERTLRPLYERFDGFEPPRELFVGQIQELRSYRDRTSN